MLVNLSPISKFNTEMQKWCKYRNRVRKLHNGDYDDFKPYSIKFTDIFKPTKYTGVYFDGTIYNIKDWCKQTPVYNTKGYRKMLRDLSKNSDMKAYLKEDNNAWNYGVADNLEQIVDYYNKNEDGYFSGNHVILAHKVTKNPEEPCSGWRWHKWGPYIGTQNPKCEYLNDEPEINEVIVFSIYKII